MEAVLQVMAVKCEMREIAKSAGITREALYKALRPGALLDSIGGSIR